MQQKIIDVLDTAEYVEITGKGENQTNMQVQLAAISNQESRRSCENCVADVNIPLGEVFTSPKLAGTNGILNVNGLYRRYPVPESRHVNQGRPCGFSGMR